MLAGALAGSASDSTQGTVAGAQTGKNATENNFLAVPLPTVPPVAGNASDPNSEANQQLALALQQALKSLGQSPSQLCADNIDLCLKSTPLLAGLAAEYGITAVKDYLKSWFSGSATEQERTIVLDPKDTPKLEGKPISEENKGLTTTTPIPEQNKKDGVLGTPIPEESQDLAALPGTEVGVGNWRDNIVTAEKDNLDSTINSNDFFKGTRYTDKVKQQASSGDYHGFPEAVDGFAGKGKVTEIIGGDGIPRFKLEIPGEYKGQSGVFEYIKNPDGTINHRLFVPKK